jgi:hypothetical protein
MEIVYILKERKARVCDEPKLTMTDQVIMWTILSNGCGDAVEKVAKVQTDQTKFAFSAACIIWLRLKWKIFES